MIKVSQKTPKRTIKHTFFLNSGGMPMGSLATDFMAATHCWKHSSPGSGSRLNLIFMSMAATYTNLHQKPASVVLIQRGMGDHDNFLLNLDSSYHQVLKIQSLPVTCTINIVKSRKKKTLYMLLSHYLLTTFTITKETIWTYETHVEHKNSTNAKKIKNNK